MKKLIAVVFIAVCSAGIVPAQEPVIAISGEIKTGLFWYNTETETRDPESGTFIHNNDDTTPASLISRGGHSYYKDFPGRFRLNFQVDKGNVGTKFRFETTQWSNTDNENPLNWGYAFAYGYFFDNNLKISAGKMGDSPWASGGPEMWRELDTTIGMRFEFIPQFIPFIAPGSLNLGFVLNNFDGGAEDSAGHSGYFRITLGDVLSETVMGISYTHDYFLVRLAYRMDSLADGPVREKFLFRLEERALQKLVPGLQFWANGFFDNLNPRRVFYEDADTSAPISVSATNWFYLQYAPEWFTAQIRLGYDLFGESSIFYARAGFYYNLFNKFLIPGIAFEYAQDSGPGRRGSDNYLRWYIEPQIRLDFGNGTYVAFVYRYQDDWEQWNTAITATLNSKTHWFNLRTVFTF